LHDHKDELGAVGPVNAHALGGRLEPCLTVLQEHLEVITDTLSRNFVGGHAVEVAFVDLPLEIRVEDVRGAYKPVVLNALVGGQEPDEEGRGPTEEIRRGVRGREEEEKELGFGEGAVRRGEGGERGPAMSVAHVDLLCTHVDLL
jgi:hypothetical protein